MIPDGEEIQSPPPSGGEPASAQRGDKPFAVRRGRVDSLNLYEITEEELRQLGEGSPVNVYLNLAISAISIAVSFGASLATSTFKSAAVQFTFIAITVATVLVFVIFGVLWLRCRRVTSHVINKIKSRTPT